MIGESWAVKLALAVAAVALSLAASGCQRASQTSATVPGSIVTTNLPGQVGRPHRIGPLQVALTSLTRKGDVVTVGITTWNTTNTSQTIDADLPRPWIIDSRGRLVLPGGGGESSYRVVGTHGGAVVLRGKGAPRVRPAILRGGSVTVNESFVTSLPGGTLNYDPVRGYSPHKTATLVTWKLP